MCSLTWHTDTPVAASFIDAGALVLAGIRLALVDVAFAPTTLEPVGAVAPVGPRSVDAHAPMFAG